jgi:hypothetical protein
VEDNEKGVGVLKIKGLKKGRLLAIENFLGYYLSSSGECGDSESEGVIRA